MTPGLGCLSTHHKWDERSSLTIFSKPLITCGNQDAQGVVYDVVFTPDDGSPVTHDIHTLPTNGQTLVPAADQDPILIDPVTYPNKPKGKYQVVPVQLQVDDWTDPDSGNGDSGQSGTNALGAQPNDVDVTKDQQIGVIGDMVDSNQKGKVDHPQRHFVSPKRSSVSPQLNKPTVRLRAQVPHADEDHFADYYTWECKDQDNHDAGSADGKFYDVPRDNPGHFTVKLINKSTGAALDANTINVWIVWVSISVNPGDKGEITETSEGTNGVGTRIKGACKFTFQTIPHQISDSSGDIPDLTGFWKHPVDGEGGWFLQPSVNLLRGADHKWDVSRQARAKVLNPYNVSPPYVSQPPPRAADYPPDSHPTLGNDDIDVLNEVNDPYNNNGILIDYDTPGFALAAGPYPENATFEYRMQFKEFCRLEIGGVWYLVSDYFPWRFHLKAIISSGRWTNNASEIELDNNNYD